MKDSNKLNSDVLAEKSLRGSKGSTVSISPTARGFKVSSGFVGAGLIAKLMRKGKKEKVEVTLIKALKKVEPISINRKSYNPPSVKRGVVVASQQGSPAAIMKGLVSANKSSEGGLLEKVIDNAKPLIRLKKVRIAGATHQKPVGLTKKQAETAAMKRLIVNANGRTDNAARSIVLKLSKEFEEIYLNTLANKTLTEVRDLHKLAEANKANIGLVG